MKIPSNPKLPHDLPDRIARRLALPLPGRAAQRSFAPELSYGRHHGPAPRRARRAAVLAMLYPHHDQWHLPLILRPDKMRDHAGQVGLPGGMLELGESPEQGALREWNEEVGFDPRGCTLLGRLSPLYVYASDFHVMPCVAAMSEQPAFSVNVLEVAELIELPLVTLLDDGCIGEHAIERGSLQFRAPHFCHGRHHVWGATCLILAELRQVIRDAIRPAHPAFPQASSPGSSARWSE